MKLDISPLVISQISTRKTNIILNIKQGVELLMADKESEVRVCLSCTNILGQRISKIV